MTCQPLQRVPGLQGKGPSRASENWECGHEAFYTPLSLYPAQVSEFLLDLGEAVMVLCSQQCFSYTFGKQIHGLQAQCFQGVQPWALHTLWVAGAPLTTLQKPPWPFLIPGSGRAAHSGCPSVLILSVPLGKSLQVEGTEGSRC